MSTVRKASVASPPSGPIEFADGLRAAIDTLASQYDRNGKRGWQPAEARGLEKELHALAARVLVYAGSILNTRYSTVSNGHHLYSCSRCQH